jgi:hypothetical protein
VRLLALLLLAASAQATRVEGDHFAVILDFENEAIAQAALEQVEKLWGPAADLYGLPKGARRDKLEVHLYRDAAAYRRADTRLTGGKFQRNQAFAHWNTKSAHVALQPYVSDAVLARVGLPHLTRNMLLHEAAHIVRYTAMKNFRSHPDWFEDGIAMALAQEVLAPDAWQAVPLYATFAVRAQRGLERGEMPAAAAILADDTDALGFYERYATRGLFVRFLREKHAAELRRIVRKMRSLAGGADFTERMVGVVRKEAGDLDQGFRDYVKTRKPEWEELYRGLEPRAGGFLQIAFPDTNAICFRTAKVGKKDYELRAQVEILAGPKQQLNLLLDRRGDSFLSVALVAGYGVTLFEYDGDWKRVASQPHVGIVAGKPLDVRALVRGTKLQVLIGKDAVVTADFPKRGMDGPFGLGAQAGAAGYWKNVVVE